MRTPARYEARSFAYLKRSLTLPFFSLKVPAFWSARPSAFLSSSPLVQYPHARRENK
jgi:hypothetical protein